MINNHYIEPKTEIIKIGIRFGDNDFAKTIENFMRLIDFNNSENNYSKEIIADAFNKIAPDLYFLGNGFKNYSEEIDEVGKPPYLSINVNDIYFNSEVDNYIEKCEGWDDGGFYWVSFLKTTTFYDFGKLVNLVTFRKYIHKVEHCDGGSFTDWVHSI